MNDMNTPIFDFVNKYAESNPARLHMPGHKGVSFLGVEKYDITEIDGADVLYNAKGIIRESEKNASSLFDSGMTFYSAEGSSLSIRAMLYSVSLYAKKNKKSPLVYAGRNAHKAFVSVLSLLDLDVEWLYGENAENPISCDISAEYLDRCLSSADALPVAVYITSPDYLGNVADVKGISRVCKKHGVLLLVDNAHGAYLHFLPVSRHPLSLGADMCCDSAHKTLPVLTGGGYLHISKNADSFFCENMETALSLFASTSPSYLILQSLDLANKYLCDGYREKLAHFVNKVDSAKKELSSLKFTLIGDEELKITVKAKEYGYFGYELAEKLAKENIICEFSDRDFITLMLSPENEETELNRIITAFSRIDRREGITEAPPVPTSPKRALSIRDAMLSPSEKKLVFHCKGDILATANVACPPAIPLLVCGELIDDTAIECLSYYGIDSVRVVTKKEDKI